MTKGAGRYDQSVAFLRNLDADWARLIDLVGPCLHDPKAAREPYEALIRAIAYQQLTAKAGDAIIGRLKALFKDAPFPTPANLIEVDCRSAARMRLFGHQDRNHQGYCRGLSFRTDPLASRGVIDRR
jgi:3-methyladenine DNA glycosylase/8-oxoguanine DNA glycosylase